MTKSIAAALLALTVASVGFAVPQAVAAPHHKVCTMRTSRVHVGHRWVMHHTRVCR